MADARGADPRAASLGRAPGGARGPRAPQRLFQKDLATRAVHERAADAVTSVLASLPHPLQSAEREPSSTLPKVRPSLCSGAGILGPPERGGFPNSVLEQRGRRSSGPRAGWPPNTLCSESRIRDPGDAGDPPRGEPCTSVLQENHQRSKEFWGPPKARTPQLSWRTGSGIQGLRDRASPETYCLERISHPRDGFWERPKRRTPQRSARGRGRGGSRDSEQRKPSN